MGGAPITVTLYKNGIHVTLSQPELFSAPELERGMARAYDEGQDVDSMLWYGGALAPLLDHVAVAIDCVFGQDRRHETHPGTPVRLVPKPPPQPGKKARRRKR
jgi:hypothetical protein